MTIPAATPAVETTADPRAILADPNASMVQVMGAVDALEAAVDVGDFGEVIERVFREAHRALAARVQHDARQLRLAVVVNVRALPDDQELEDFVAKGELDLYRIKDILNNKKDLRHKANFDTIKMMQVMEKVYKDSEGWRKGE